MFVINRLMALMSMIQEVVGSLRAGVGAESRKIMFLCGTSYSILQTL